MSNALHDYARLFERYAGNNNGMGVILAGEDCLSLANEMRMDADAIEAENAKLLDEKIDAYNDKVVAQLEADELKAENSKLRKLLRDAVYARDDADWASIVSAAIALGVEVEQ